jgi:hypothetical protein
MAQFEEIPSFNIHNEDGTILDQDAILEERLVYESDIPGVGIVIVPEGFVTDFASIPRLPGIRFLFPVNDRHRLAAVVHDYLVRRNDFNRHTADKVFLEAMKVLKVPRTRRRVMYYAVSAMTWWLKLRGKK